MQLIPLRKSIFKKQSRKNLPATKISLSLIFLWMLLAINSWRSFYPFTELSFYIFLTTAAFARLQNVPNFALLPIYAPLAFPIYRPYVITFGILVFIGALKGRLKSLRRVLKIRMILLAVLFTLFYAASCIISPNFNEAMRYTGTVLQALAFLILLTVFLDSPAAVITTIKVIVCLSGLAFFISLANFLWRDGMWITEYSKLITSVFDWDPVEKYSVMFGKIVLGGRLMYAGLEPNYWGAQLQFPLWLAIGLARASERFKQKLVWTLAGVLILIGIIGTYSRASFLTVMGVGIFYLMRNRFKGSLPLIILGIIGITMIVLSPLLIERFGGILEDVSTRGGSGRLDLWIDALGTWASSPLWGHGAASYVDQFGIPLAAHNTYLHILAELGLIGLSIYVGIIYIGVRSWYRGIVITKSNGSHQLSLIAEGGFLGAVATYLNIASITAQDAMLVWLPAVIGLTFYMYLGKVFSPPYSCPRGV